jgi:nucleoside-diphosphate-sugar epimerase
VRQAQPDAVVHLAARTDLSEEGDLSGYAANIQGVENLVSAIRQTPSVRRAVCTSSRLVCRIGYTPKNDEDFQPTTLYGESKVRTEQIWRQADGGGVAWCLVRPTTIWGPGMNPHYLTFFRMLRAGRYIHVGARPTLKSYGYVGNTVYQYVRLLEVESGLVHRKVLYLADYTPIAVEDWAEQFQRALRAPRIRTVPLWFAQTVAKTGDLLNWLGWSRFPLNSFRLTNVLTPFHLDTSATEQLCGPLPFTMEEGVEQTVEWLRSLWAKQVN